MADISRTSVPVILCSKETPLPLIEYQQLANFDPLATVSIRWKNIADGFAIPNWQNQITSYENLGYGFLRFLQDSVSGGNSNNSRQGI
jgi:hypothetical protein